MGEYADMVVDAMTDVDYYQLLGRFDDEDDPYWNPFSGRWRGFRPRPKTCKRCGQDRLWWGQGSNGKWRLETVDGAVHYCQLGFKAALAKLRLDSDPGIAYNEYLDNIPQRSAEEVRDIIERSA